MVSDMSRSGKVLGFWFLALFILAGWTAADAAIINPTITLTNDINGDGIAGLGDSITFSCRSTNASDGVTPFVDLSLFGNPQFVLPRLVLNNNYFSAVFPLNSPRAVDQTPIFRFADENSIMNVTCPFAIDVQRPTSTLGIELDASQAHGTGGIYIFGDNLAFTIRFSDTDAQNGRLRVFVNLNNLGMGTNIPVPHAGNGDFTFNQPLPPGRDDNSATFDILATDDAGNTQTFASAISVDTRVPDIISAVAAPTTTPAPQYIKAGDQVRIRVVLDNYDSEIVTASHAVLIPGSPERMTRVSQTGNQAEFEYDFTVPSTVVLEDKFVRFWVEAKDNAGNIIGRWTNALWVDTEPPDFARADVNVLQIKTRPKGPFYAGIGDVLKFSGDLKVPVKEGEMVTIDMSPINGITNQIMTSQIGSTTFTLDFTVFQGTSEDHLPRNFQVKVVDEAGNTKSRFTMPTVWVDNDPPTISAGFFQNVTNPGTTAKLGDLVGIQANVTKMDGGAVWCMIPRLGGSTASTTLTMYAASTYRHEHIIAAPQPGFPSVDGGMSLLLTVTDDMNNEAVTDTNQLVIDNEPPVILAATWTVSPPLSAVHPYVRIGDTVRFSVSLASSTNSVHDSETVTMNLVDLGGVANQQLAYDGMGTYSFQLVVKNGPLNTDTSFPAIARDNAGNTAQTNMWLPVDNSAPTPGPMVVNWLTDLHKVGTINISDRLEFIVPVDDPDFGTCTLDLSMVGSTSAHIMGYDLVLKRYYLVYDCASASIENPGYVFRAVVSDKAGNTMNSLSSTFEVDCVPPVLNYASATFQNLVGSTTVVNVGDKVTITAEVDPARLDGGVPTVNLTAIGGNSAQQLYDDGAHDDNAAGDGIYGYTHKVVAGSTDGEVITFNVSIVDNAGNRTFRFTDPLFVDNQPLVITSCQNIQVFDNNGNNVVDLDGVFTTFPSVATDQLRLDVELAGNTTDYGQLTVDLTSLGYAQTASIVPVITKDGGWSASQIYLPIRGNTNRQNVQLQVRATDVNGNITLASAASPVLVDNFPPTMEVYPISFVVDTGRLNEANLGDVIQLRVRMSNHDGILPQIDFTNLYLENGMAPPSPILFPPGGPNEYSYDWTVPEGLGTIASLTLIGYDQSGNMTVGWTNQIRFLSRTPVIMAYPDSQCSLASDPYPPPLGNNIANPNVGDRVSIQVALSSAYNLNNTPPATVIANIRSIFGAGADDENPLWFDGDFSTYWAALTYQPPPVSGPGKFVYSRVFDVFDGRTDVTVASFNVRIIHPDTSSIVMASTTVHCDPANPFAIDTLRPVITNLWVNLEQTGGDSVSSAAGKIGDYINVTAEINDFDDPGSATVFLFDPGGTVLADQAVLHNIPGSNLWEAGFLLATTTLSGWPAFDGVRPLIRVFASDDADNQANVVQRLATFTIDNSPPIILAADLLVSPDQATLNIGNVGDGFRLGQGDNLDNDGIVASVTVASFTDLTGGRIWVDLSPILGSSTCPVMNGPWTTRNSDIFYLATYTLELATHTIDIWFQDPSGNKTRVERQICVDTTRPKLEFATYDGLFLTVGFSEFVQRNSVRVDLIRVGRRQTHAAQDLMAGEVVTLDPNNDLIINQDDSQQYTLALGSGTKAIIADWGDTSLYISMSSNSFGNTDFPWLPVARDLAGNWLVPVPRVPATHSVTITASYTVRPKLVGGYYNAATPEEARWLYLDFDRDMDQTTISSYTMRALALWRNMGNPADDFSNRYRFINTIASDNFVQMDSLRRARLRLSDQAQEWIAQNFTRSGIYLPLQVDDRNDFRPPLMRDLQGNAVQPIPYQAATPATLIPLTTQFVIQNVALDISGVQPMLTIGFQNNPERRARLYLDPYQALQETINRSRDLPVDLSRIYLYQNGTMTGGYFPLNNTMVDMAAFRVLNTDYASATVRIPLTVEALNTMLSWGTSRFYLAAEIGAFQDLWGNTTIRYPAQGGVAQEIINVIVPTGYQPARIHSLAVAPVSRMLGLPLDEALCKGQPSGAFFYEVAFETATISTNVHIPIDRTQLPELRLYDQIDFQGPFLPPSGLPIDTASFVAWLDHDMGGTKRTVARFVNTVNTSSGNFQRDKCFVYVTNFRDILSTAMENGQTSRAYDLSQKSTGITGFNSASYSLTLDNRPPVALFASPTGVLGRVPVLGMEFSVTYDEVMNTDPGSQPGLTLVQGNTSVMSFTFQRWEAGGTRAVFRNASPFDENTLQGVARYRAGGGYDEAGNQYVDTGADLGELDVRSKGPIINWIRVETLQFTVSESAVPLLDKPFSPFVTPGIATISMEFAAPHAEPLWLHLYYTGAAAPFASRSITLVNGVLQASWDGTENGTIIAGEKSIELRVYDALGNEGSRRWTLSYDPNPPNVLTWRSTNAVLWDGMIYFSPVVHSFVKIESIGPSAGQALYLGALAPTAPPATFTWVMAPLTGGGYTTTLDGTYIDAVTGQTGLLVDGTYPLYVIDAAGNIGVPLGVTGQNSIPLVVDRTPPEIDLITLTSTLTGAPVTRFNPNVSSLTITVSSTDLTVSSGTALVRIKAGSEIVRDISIILQGGTELVAVWDGKNATGQLVEDGTYQISVIDRAQNESVTRTEVTVLSSMFELTAVKQIDARTIRAIFSHEVNLADAGTLGNYTLSPGNPLGLGAVPPIQIDGKTVDLPLNAKLAHDVTYTLTITPGFRSIDEYGIQTGYNSAQFTADTQGPLITNVTFDGISSQRQFNVVFDEVVASTSAQTIGNYRLTTGTATVAISSVELRPDNKSVKITAFEDVVEDQNYTIIASGVRDVFRNPSDGALARALFQGQDVTPPVLTISVFSNPANEFDIVIAVTTNEALSAAPAARITQSGGTAVNLQLNPGPTNLLYIGGAHLDRNYPGVATIQATGKDMAGNAGIANISFSTAFVNANVLATLLSPDQQFQVTFQPSVLSQNSLVSVIPVPLRKVEGTGAEVANIRPALLADLPAGVRFPAILADVGVQSKVPADELEPVSHGYAVSIPGSRLCGHLHLSWRHSPEFERRGVGVFQQATDGGWQLVGPVGTASASEWQASQGGTFALLRDLQAPRARMVAPVAVDQPIREERPLFRWDITETGAGVEPSSLKVVLNGREETGFFDADAAAVFFKPLTPLMGGENSIGISVSDKLGNVLQLPAVRFQVLLPLQIFEVQHFPNPARQRVAIRISTNRPDVDLGEIEVKIYDVAGHKVVDQDRLTLRSGTNGAGKLVQDLMWDLRNAAGREVANGVYIARIVLRDPDNWEQKAKYTHKIAVLR